jgi:hypothetical protein
MKRRLSNKIVFLRIDSSTPGVVIDHDADGCWVIWIDSAQVFGPYLPYELKRPSHAHLKHLDVPAIWEYVFAVCDRLCEEA